MGNENCSCQLFWGWGIPLHYKLSVQLLEKVQCKSERALQALSAKQSTTWAQLELITFDQFINSYAVSILTIPYEQNHTFPSPKSASDEQDFSHVTSLKTILTYFKCLKITAGSPLKSEGYILVDP